MQNYSELKSEIFKNQKLLSLDAKYLKKRNRMQNFSIAFSLILLIDLFIAFLLIFI
jgi:hypothetical protein